MSPGGRSVRSGAMRAWRVHELGEPEAVLRLDEVDAPTAGPGEVLVDVAAASLNFPDVLMCRGEYQVKPPLPFTPGAEVAAPSPRSVTVPTRRSWAGG